MDWTALSGWIYENTRAQDVQQHLGRVKVVYVDPRSSNAPATVAELRAAGVLAGAYFAVSWFPNYSALEFAAAVSHSLNTLLPRIGSAEAPPCMLDVEGKPTAWAVEAIQDYRLRQPNRPTAYTVEPFQGGYVPAAALTEAHMHLYPQCYYGDMRLADAAAVVLEQARRMPPGMVHPFYDGASLPDDSRDGCVFTLERMP